MIRTSRKSRPLDRSLEYRRDTRLVIIAAEGRKTEQQYFALFRSTRVQIKVLATGEDNRSAPEQVLARLRQFRDEYSLDEDDSLWLMLDVDRWGSKKLSAMAREARTARFGLAVSNPCFEVWLLFHVSERIPDTDKCADIEMALRAQLGGSYNKTNLDAGRFLSLVPLATPRAQTADPAPRGRWPIRPGSHVYRIIRHLPADCLPG